MFSASNHRHHRKFSPPHILSQKNPHPVAHNAFEIAVELALLGRIPSATKLFNLFAEFAPECRATWSPGMYFAWEASGLWPDAIPPEARTEENLKKLEVERVLWKRSTCCSEEGLEGLIKTATGQNSARRDEYGNPIIQGHDLKAAIDLAAYMNKPEKVQQLLEVFADSFGDTWYRLARSRLVWPYLKDGALARTLGISEEKLASFEKEVLETFTQRLTNGPARIHKDLSMKALVDLCNTNTLKNAHWDDFDTLDPENTRSTILHPPATPSQISDLESRLGMSLPEDYKSFLSETNGLGPLWNGFHAEPDLLPADKVFITDAQKEQKKMNKARVDVGFFMNLNVTWEPLTNIIQLNAGTPESRYVWLLPPEQVRSETYRFMGALQQLEQKERDHVIKMMSYSNMAQATEGSFSVENDNWIVCVWSPEALELTNYYSFREFLEGVAQETANEDILDEEDEQGRLLHSQDVFAYQLR